MAEPKKTHEPEWLKKWKSERAREALWELPEVSEIQRETEKGIKVTLEVDANRARVLHKAAEIMAEIAENVKKFFHESNLKDLVKKGKRAAVVEGFKNKLSSYNILENLGNSVEDFRNIPLVRDLLTPEVYARINYTLNELYKRVRAVVLALERGKFNEKAYAEFKKTLEDYFDFQINAFEDAFNTVNNFPSQFEQFGTPFITLEQSLNDALKIPGYPDDSIRALHTIYKQKAEMPDLKSYYAYYRDSRYSPQELIDNKEILQKEKQEELQKLITERHDHIRNIVNKVEDRKAFTDILRNVLMKSKDDRVKGKIKKDTPIDFNNPEIIEILMVAKVFEYPDVFGFLAEKGVLDDALVLESIGKIEKLQKRIEIWKEWSVDKMLENKFRNENFAKLLADEMSFHEMHDLYDKWQEVKEKVTK